MITSKTERHLYLFLFALACLLSLILSTFWYVRKDITQEKLYTLSPYTLKVLENLESNVEISWFRSSSLSLYVSESQYIFHFLNEAELLCGGKIILKIYNADDVEEKKLSTLGFATHTIEKKGVHNISKTSIYSGLILQLKGASRVIPFLSSISNLEYMLVNFILQINAEKRGSEMRISFINATVGTKDETSDGKRKVEQKNEVQKDFSYLKQWLEYSGFKVDELSLPIKAELEMTQPLIVVGSCAFDADSALYIDIFLKKKGRAVFFVSANKVDVAGQWIAKKKAIDPLMEILLERGVEIESNIVLDIPNFPIKMLRRDGEGSETVNYPCWPIILRENIQYEHPIFAGIHSLQTFWPSSIKINLKAGKHLKSLAKTTKESISMEEAYQTDPFSPLFALFADGKHAKTSHSIVVLSEKLGRLLVISDELMLSRTVEYTDSSINFDFAVNIALWLDGKDSLLQLKRKQHTLLPFRFYEENVFALLIGKARVICFLVVPTAIILVYILMRRRA